MLAFAVADAHGNLPEGHKIDIKAVVDALFIAAKNLGRVFLKEFTEFFV
jgi:hypothetical protein